MLTEALLQMGKREFQGRGLHLLGSGGQAFFLARL